MYDVSNDFYGRGGGADQKESKRHLQMMDELSAQVKLTAISDTKHTRKHELYVG